VLNQDKQKVSRESGTVGRREGGTLSNGGMIDG
jgi:hypothetical protein